MAVPIPELVRSNVDGIPTFAVDGPRPFTAMLQFRVGKSDEPMRMRGITHLVEHLAIYAHRDTEIAFNGSVGPLLTSFWAQGHPDEVGAFLREVAQSIHDLPYDRLDLETDVLQRELAMIPPAHIDRILFAYFGPFGPGTLPQHEPGLSWLGPTELDLWAETHFTIDNAALVVLGKVPDSWGIELPKGRPVHYRLSERVRKAPDAPTLFDTQEGGVTWAALLKDRKGLSEPAVSIGTQIVSRRLQDRLRHDLGQTYSVGEGFERLDEDHILIYHGFDAEPSRSREAANEHLQVINEFVSDGPSQDEIDRHNRMLERAMEDRPLELAWHRVTDVAEAHLHGWERTVDYAEWIAECKAISPEDVRARFEEANRQSYTIANLPDGALAPLRDAISSAVAPLPMPGAEWRIRTIRVPPGHPKSIRFGPQGISIGWADGWIHEKVDEIALVAFADGMLTIDASYTSVNVALKKYRKTRRGGSEFDVREASTMEKAARHYLPEELLLPGPRR